MGKITIYDANELTATFIEDLKMGQITEYGDAISCDHLAVLGEGTRYNWNYNLQVTAETIGMQRGRERYRIDANSNDTNSNRIVIYADYNIDELTKAIEKIQYAIIKEIRQKDRDENAISFFREKTEQLFNKINDYTATEIENIVKDFIISIFIENDIDVAVNVGEVAIYGSRSRGLENTDSDIDVVVEIESDLKEYTLFNIVNEVDFEICGIKVDINPIRKEETGTLRTYLPIAEQYLAEKAKKKTKGE